MFNLLFHTESHVLYHLQLGSTILFFESPVNTCKDFFFSDLFGYCLTLVSWAFFFITRLPKGVVTTLSPLILMILVLEDRYEFALSIDTKKYQWPFFWRHNDVLMTPESRKTEFYGFWMKICKTSNFRKKS